MTREEENRLEAIADAHSYHDSHPSDYPACELCNPPRRVLPWTFEPRMTIAGEVLDAKGYTVARIDGYPEDGALMAAAPEMFAALLTLLNLEGATLAGARLPAFQGLDVPYHFAKARAAIEKAGGSAAIDAMTRAGGL